MKHWLAAVVIIFSYPVMADDLDDANAACVPHIHTYSATANGMHLPYRPPTYDPGWEHCEKISVAYETRKEARDAADEEKNPQLKKSRDVAKGLAK